MLPNSSRRLIQLSKTAVISTKIESGLKEDVNAIFKKLGLSATEAITMFYRMVRKKNGLPFETEIPNEETLEAIREIEEGKDLVRCKDTDHLFKELGI